MKLNEPIVIVNETIELINYNFLDIEEFRLPFESRVQRIVFLQILENDLLPPHYDLTTNFTFHRNMIEAINLVSSAKEIVIENYPFLDDAHFKFMYIFRWEMLTKISLTRCPNISNKFFGWVSNNCRCLRHFKMTCINTIYGKSNNEELERYYCLESENVIKFFANNRRTLEICQLQLSNLGRLRDVSEGLDDFVSSILKCSNLCKVCLYVKESYDYEVASVLKIIASEKISLFKFVVGRKTVIHLYHNDGCDGFLEIFNRSPSSAVTEMMNANLISVLKAQILHVSHVTLSNVVISGSVLASLCSNQIKSLKLLNCGTNFSNHDTEVLFKRSELMQFFVVVEGSSSFGTTNIHWFENRVVCAIKLNGVKWTVSDVKHHKKKLVDKDYVWLIDEAEGKIVDSDSECEDN